MKPPKLDYARPATLDDAISTLSAGAGDARPLAGGQSLVPLLNFRLGAPGMLVDLEHVPELAGMQIERSSIKIGAMTPTARLLQPAVVAASSLLAAAGRLVGHPQIRTRGTVGGSIAHADPAAELPAVALLTEAVIEVAGPRGNREVDAEAFFEGIFATACDWDELVVSVRFPRPADGEGWGFHELTRRPGDFALVGVGATVRMTGGAIDAVRIVAFAVGGVPIRVRGAEAALLNDEPRAELIAGAVQALEAEIDPGNSVHGSSEYRRHVAGVLLKRALADAIDRAGETREAR